MSTFLLTTTVLTVIDRFDATVAANESSTMQRHYNNTAENSKKLRTSDQRGVVHSGQIASASICSLSITKQDGEILRFGRFWQITIISDSLVDYIRYQIIATLSPFACNLAVPAK